MSAVTIESLAAQVAALTALVERLLAASTPQKDANPALPPIAPDGYVAIKPTGVNGGEVRFYPDPKLVLNFEGKPVQSLPGYLSQIQNDPRWAAYGPYWDYGRQGWYGAMPVSGPQDFPEATDRLIRPEAWRTAEEEGRRAAEQARDAEMFKGRDGFLPQPATVAHQAEAVGAPVTPSGVVTEVAVDN